MTQRRVAVIVVAWLLWATGTWRLFGGIRLWPFGVWWLWVGCLLFGGLIALVSTSPRGRVCWLRGTMITVFACVVAMLVALTMSFHAACHAHYAGLKGNVYWEGHRHPVSLLAERKRTPFRLWTWFDTTPQWVTGVSREREIGLENDPGSGPGYCWTSQILTDEATRRHVERLIDQANRARPATWLPLPPVNLSGFDFVAFDYACGQ